MSFHPFAGAEAGYDSNLDGAALAIGSGFGKLEAGFGIEAKTTGASYALLVRGQDFGFDNLSDSQRWDFKTLLTATYDWNPDTALTLESEFVRDFYTLYPADIFINYANYVQSFDTVDLRLKAKSTVEKSLSGKASTDYDGDYDGSGPDDPDALQELLSGSEYDEGDPDQGYFSTPRNPAFDFSRSEVHFALLTNTKGLVQPFGIGNAADLDYFNQEPQPLIDRNAVDLYGIAGVRLMPNREIWIDLGYRVNNRDFEDKRVTAFTSEAPDIHLHWQLEKDVKITGRIERFIREPTSLAGLADDVKAHSATLDWQILSNLGLSLKGSYDRITAIGDAFVYDKYFARLDLMYEPVEHVELFAQVLGRYVDEQHFGSEIERYRFSTGFNVRY